jgi:Asp-tRNA(Asn)/Glu-tRNA(Gln) amidotransferase C subunit
MPTSSSHPPHATSSFRFFSEVRTLRHLQNESGEPPSSPPTTTEPELNIREYLSKPSWSVESLLPTPEQTAAQPPVSPKQLRHLLRLSALLQPKDVEEEARMLETLASQLYFVQQIQKVDTTGVEPLRALRDESLEAETASEVTLESLKEALDQEEVIGEHHKRIRRKQGQVNVTDNPEGWRPLDHAQRKVGKFFVVNSGTTSPA